MTTFKSSNLETLGVYDWTGTSASNAYLQLVETADYGGFGVNQGTYALETGVDAAAGWAQARMDYATGLGVGDYSHFGTYILNVRSADDWPAIQAPVIPSSSVKIIAMMNQDDTEAISVRMDTAAGSTYGKKFKIYCATAAQWSNPSSDGLQGNTWNKLDLYLYIHATDGYAQLRINSVTVCEMSGINTSMGKDQNRIVHGINWKGDASSRLALYWDGTGFIWDDAVSPSPPETGGRARRKVFGGLGGILPRGGGLVSGSQALIEYRRLEAA